MRSLYHLGSTPMSPTTVCLLLSPFGSQTTAGDVYLVTEFHPLPVQPGLKPKTHSDSLADLLVLLSGQLPLLRHPDKQIPATSKVWTSGSSCTAERPPPGWEPEQWRGNTGLPPRDSLLWCSFFSAWKELYRTHILSNFVVVSVGSKSGITYQVTAGGSLWKIFRKHNNVNSGPNLGAGGE